MEIYLFIKSIWGHVTKPKSFKYHQNVIKENVSQCFGTGPLKMLLMI